jgi:hypothetical protein
VDVFVGDVLEERVKVDLLLVVPPIADRADCPTIATTG